MTIKDMEERSGLPRANIRYYETEGLLSPTRLPNGYRDYSEDDLATLMKIKLLRELGCSLEEIAALQKNEAALDHVLERRLAALEGEAVSLARAKDICAQLRADGATYATLDPERYIPRDAPTVIPWEPIPPSPPHYPWRRFFARSLDFMLVNTLVWFLRTLLFDVSILAPTGFGTKLLLAALSLLIVVIAEPLMLHRWGTTPGKWVFRLRLVQENGAPLDRVDAFGRTLNVLLAGCGLTIPLVSLVTYILAFRREMKDIDQPWAVEGEVFEDAKPGKDFHAARSVGLYVLTVVLSVGLLLCGEWKVARLPYSQPTTYQEFAANYNAVFDYYAIQRYNDPPSISSRYWCPDTADQLWYDEETQDYHAGMSLTHLSFQFADPEDPAASALAAVKLDIDLFSTNTVSYPAQDMAYALIALEGNSALIWDPFGYLAQRVSCLENGDMEGLKHLPDGRWHAYLDYRVSGGRLGDSWGYYTFEPNYDAKYDNDLQDWVHFPTTQHVVLTFRLRRVNGT